MEQKKTLWIIAAVGVFLLVVLGAALILYSPASKGTQTLALSKQNDSSSNGWISLAPSEVNQRQRAKPMQEDDVFNAQGATDMMEDENALEDFEKSEETLVMDGESLSEKQLPKNKSLKVGELTVYADNATIVSSQLGENGDADSSTAIEQNGSLKKTAQNQGYDASSITTTIDLKIDVADSSATAQGTSTINAASSASTTAVARAEAPRVEKTASYESKPKVVKTEVKSAPKPVASKPLSAPAKAPVEKAAPKATEKTQFWVQVTALSSRKNADVAREVLAENEINADVFTYTDAKGRLFYRVRVGPYMTKSEAEYWQGKIAKIDSFQSNKSYIASTKTEIN